jgi:hypothetical protein
MPKKPDDASIASTEREVKRFIRAEYMEFMRIGYPRMSTFARDIARGDIGMPPPTEVDPIMDEVGRFYWKLNQIERRVLADKYCPDHVTEKERCKRVGQTIHRNRRMLERLLKQCGECLSTFDARREAA